MARLLLRYADWIYTCDDARRVIQDGYVLIEDGRIAAVGSEPAPAIDADEVVSVAGCVVMPGMVNIHHHLYQTLTRAVPIGMRTDILGWLYAMYPLWAELDGDAEIDEERALAGTNRAVRRLLDAATRRTGIDFAAEAASVRPAATAETGLEPRIDTHTVLGHFQTPVTLEN